MESANDFFQVLGIKLKHTKPSLRQGRCMHQATLGDNGGQRDAPCWDQWLIDDWRVGTTTSSRFLHHLNDVQTF